MASHAFAPFDEADFLKTEQDIATYLAVVAEDGDPEEMVAALAAVARARNMSALARDTGLTRVGLYKALAPNGNPGFGTVTKVARALGYGISFVRVDNDPHALAGKVRVADEGQETGVRNALSAERGGRISTRGTTGQCTTATGKKAASTATEIIRAPKASDGDKTAVASVLSQAKRKGRKT